MASEVPKLLWNAENIKDVAESVGIGALNEEATKALAQDVEYRVGQVIIESLRLMRAARRTTLTVNDVSLALRVLDAEPLYGYDSTRPLRFGEASLGPGLPLFYIDDEEVEFEKLINAPLPKVPRDMNFTGGDWLFGGSSSRLTIRSTLARHRRRPARHPPEPHHGRVEVAGPATQGHRRKPSALGPGGQRKLAGEPICQAHCQQGAHSVL